jgi:hypothetical protein
MRVNCFSQERERMHKINAISRNKNRLAAKHKIYSLKRQLHKCPPCETVYQARNKKEWEA